MNRTWQQIADNIAAGRLSDTARKILNAVREAENGVARAELVRLTGRATSTVEGTLAAMQSCHLIETTRNGGYSVWTTPERVEEVRAYVLSTLKVRTPEQMRRKQNLKRAERRRAKERSGRDIEVQSVKIVPATSAAPIKCGPSSVFDLGSINAAQQ